MKKVGIVILHYSDINNTKECVESVLHSEKKRLEVAIILVNNSGEDIEKIVKLAQNIECITPSGNVGYSAGNNIGIKSALARGCDFVMLLNNDAVLEKNTLEELVTFSEKENASIVSPKIYFFKGNEFHIDRYAKKELGHVIWYAGGLIDWRNVIGFHRGVDEVDKGQFDKPTQTEFASGCCMLIVKDVFNTIGFLDERFFLYYEDNDFSQRARKRGFTIMYDPKAVVWHKNAGSSGSGSDLQDYYLTRNRLLFGFMYAPIRVKVSLVKEAIKFLFEGRKWQKKGILDFFKMNFGKGSYE